MSRIEDWDSGNSFYDKGLPGWKDLANRKLDELLKKDIPQPDFLKSYVSKDALEEAERVIKWRNRWFKRAEELSTWSKDPSTKIGAVFVNEEAHRELSAGYNGFPRGILDDDRLYNREVKYKLVVHAEMNGIFNAVNNGLSLQGSSLFVWGNAGVCSECAKGIIQVGVKKLYVKEKFVQAERWIETWSTSQIMFKEAGVQVIIS